MKKETSADKHKPSEQSTHPQVPSAKAMPPHLAPISSTVLQLPDLVTDLGDNPSCSPPSGRDSTEAGCPVLCSELCTRGDGQAPQCTGAQ